MTPLHLQSGNAFDNYLPLTGVAVELCAVKGIP